jgi:hypothetical protein
MDEDVLLEVQVYRSLGRSRIRHPVVEGVRRLVERRVRAAEMTGGLTHIEGVCEVVGCRAPTHVTAFLARWLSFPLSGSLRQTRAKDVRRSHNCPHSLLMSGQGGTVTGDELAEQNIAMTQRLHGLKAL